MQFLLATAVLLLTYSIAPIPADPIAQRAIRGRPLPAPDQAAENEAAKQREEKFRKRIAGLQEKHNLQWDEIRKESEKIADSDERRKFFHKKLNEAIMKHGTEVNRLVEEHQASERRIREQQRLMRGLPPRPAGESWSTQG